MKFFNTAGPVNMDFHYKIDPLKRWDLDEILTLIAQGKYFILHAPRQTGKTSCLLALRDYLNARDQYRCVYANFEAAQAARNNIQNGIRCVIREIDNSVENTFPKFAKPDITRFTTIEPENALNSYLSTLSRTLDKPFVLLIDEIDALIGDTLVSVLRQLRSGYTNRPEKFPISIILCGVRDIKDYRIHRSNDDIITGGSCFNIKAKSLSLGDFSESEVRELYALHTQETGQKFADAVFPLVMSYTGGQPWLVNALGYEVTYEMKENRDPSVEITPALMEEAKERLILSRATHLDQLADKLNEERVRRVVEPILLSENAQVSNDDAEYCLDLGLIKRTPNGFAISNEIYREVIPRELTEPIQNSFLAMFRPEWVRSDGSLDSDKLMTMFAEFWRENSDIWGKDIAGYKEAAPHLVFHGFLQRVANGNGRIHREYALGTKRCDLLLKWRSETGEQRVVIELKTLRERYPYDKLIADALEQTADYADSCDATETHVLVFDRTGEKKEWKKRLFTETREFRGRKIKIWGL
jgi:hypothetical protein